MNATSRTPAIVGFLFVGALVLTIGFLAGRSGGGDRGTVPPLRISAPATGDTVDNPVRLAFSTPAPLSLSAMGWMADELHLHLMIDGTEYMPAAADITAAPDGFVWQLPPLPAGEHSIHLTWAGRHHGNLAGPSDTVWFTVR